MKRDTRILLFFIGLVFIFFTILRAFLFSDMGPRWHVEAGAIGLVVMITVAFIIRGIDIVLDRLYPYDRDIIMRLLLQFAVSLIFIFALRFVIVHILRHVTTVRLNRQMWAATTIIHVLSVATVILAMFSYRFFNKWKETELKKEILEKEKATVQYDNLKNQLNPHFLFNSLTSLNSLIFENPQLASEFLQQLSKVYRYVLENKEKTLVSLSTELGFISHYTKLLLSRFENGLVVNIKLSDAALDKKILPVTLQILIENAIKHNIISKDMPLQIDIYDESAYLVVKNKLQARHIIEESNKQGIENLKSLYSVLIEKEIVIEKTVDYFSIRIPLI